MRKLKKWAALGMAGILAAGCLAGCGDKKEEASGEGTAQEKTADKGEAVTLKWYLAGSGPQADVVTVQNAVNQYLKDNYDMNVDLQIIATDYANYPQKMQMVISSGEEYDICWTSSWNNNYYDNVNKNAFIPMDELLEKEAPELLASMDTSIWDAVRVKGNIYGVPSQQDYSETELRCHCKGICG